MPTAPLFYQPLVLARVNATMVGDKTVQETHNAQLELTQKDYQNPEYAPKMDAIMHGFENLQAAAPGSKSLDTIEFSYSKEGYVANRVTTAMRLHPELFDTASPDQAAEIGAKLVTEAQKELEEDHGMLAVGDMLEVAPDVTGILKQHWQGKEPLEPQAAAYIGVVAGREVQRNVTPLPPDSTSPNLQWLEDGTPWLLSLWPGAAVKTAAALGIKADAAEMEKIVGNWRGNMHEVDAKAEGPVRSVSALLGAAGITGADDAARDAAFQVLQATPLEGVPAGIAHAIAANDKLAPEAEAYVTGRIVETAGSEGNIKGLLAELELMKQPAPTQPPGGTPPPGEEPPPPNPKPGTPPPGTDPDGPPPVDPPKPGDGDGKPDESAAIERAAIGMPPTTDEKVREQIADWVKAQAAKAAQPQA
jgi:hypothetical protein